jgi:hypothetical protein
MDWIQGATVTGGITVQFFALAAQPHPKRANPRKKSDKTTHLAA